MASTIQFGVRNKRPVSLGDVQRGERDVTCYTCGGKLAVKDGDERAKHFAHTCNSACHGEGPAHYRMKASLALAIIDAMGMSAEQRNFHGQLSYRCPDEEYGPHDVFEFPIVHTDARREFEEWQHGSHNFDLLEGLARVRCEAPLANGRTRADIAGFSANDELLWIIEIKRSILSQAAIDHANEAKVPMFVVDLTWIPKVSPDSLFDLDAECDNELYRILLGNLGRGFCPEVAESFNMECERKAFGMGPTDRRWSKQEAPIHRGDGDCVGLDCLGCEEVVLHQCGALLCPDVQYMFEHGITPIQMYTSSIHKIHSHVA